MGRGRVTSSSGGVQVSRVLVHEWGENWAGDWQTDSGNVDSDADAEAVHFGEERAGPEGKAFNLQVNLHHNSHICHELWVVTQRMRSGIRAAKWAYFAGWLGSALEIELGALPLLWEEPVQVVRASGEDSSWTSPWVGALGMPTRSRRPQGRPRIGCRDFISGMV